MSVFRILVVDDESSVLDALASMLRSQLIGAVVDTAVTADAALKQLAQTSYDAIVTDIRMPDMDGLTLLKEIRALSPATPTILITGADDNELAVQALRLGAYDYIRKPPDIDYLLASLNRAIQVRQLSLKVEGQQLDLERHAIELEHTVQQRTHELSCEIAERKGIEEELRQSNLKLTDQIKELEERSQQITFLSEMTALLQACQSVQGACTVATQFLKDLFSADAGSLCLYHDSMRLVEVVASWDRTGPPSVNSSQKCVGHCDVFNHT